MSTIDDLLERILLAAGRMPGRAVAALALLIYAGGGLALPAGMVFLLGWPADTLNWSVLVIVVANFYSAVLAGLVILAWVTQQFEAGERRRERHRERRQLIEWTTDLRHLNAEEFEWLVGEVFRRDGCEVQETGSQDNSDGNIDLELMRDGQRMIVQCKLWQSWRVGIKEIRAFGGTLLREGLPSSAGIFVTFSDLTKQARVEAEKIGITLVDNRDLHDRIDKVRRTEPCPICQKPMRLDYSSQGWWFHCIAGCVGKRDLGKDPGRAVEFLTQPPST